jgi:phosphatidate phosphatase APP1
MHDFGKIVALAAAEARESLLHPSRGVEYWTNAMERHHCDVGWVMTELWRLPETVQSITARHHLPDADDALHEIVQTVDRVISTAAAARWQISANQIASIAGVRSADEAMALRIGLARHAFFFANIGEARS